MADRPEMFWPTGGFRGWPIQWNHAKCCGADPCCHGNEIWVRRGDPVPVAYRLVIYSLFFTTTTTTTTTTSVTRVQLLRDLGSRSKPPY